MLSNLPAELLIRIIQYIEQVSDKCQLLHTCRYLNHLLCTHVVCWKQLDLSPFGSTINNNSLLTFLRNTNIPLYHKSSDSVITAITALNLSGCWNLSEELIVTLSRSLRHLTDLSLNGYRLNTPMLQRRIIKQRKPQQHEALAIAFEQQRDHVYQVRPSHDLSSMAMDLSKKQMPRLIVPLILLKDIVSSLPRLTRLSIQYQDLGGRHSFQEFRHIRHLDISSCIISQPALQTLLRVVGPNLSSLKMLNIDLNTLSCFSVGQYGKQLQCLHVSCNEPLLLASMQHVVAHLPILQDFRLTRVRTGSLDPIIERLNPATLTRLDLSPKMNIYPRSTSKSNLAPHRRPGKHPPQQSISDYATTEHDLLVSHASLEHLARCHQLVELRLCFPTITASSLHDLLKHVPQLQLFEFRRRKQEAGRSCTVDFLTGLRYCQHLQELYLFSVHVSQDTVDTLILGNVQLKHITVSDGGSVVQDETNLKALLSLHMLQVLCLGQLVRPISWFTDDTTSSIVSDKQEIVFFKQNKQWHAK